MGTRGLPSAMRLLGEGLQSIALGLVERGDLNTSFTTRAVGTVTIALMLLLGSLVASYASSRSESVVQGGLLVPVVRADLVMLLLSRLLHVMIWAGKLRANKILYVNKVFPIQAAAIIWNDCKPVQPRLRSEDENAILLDTFRAQRQIWRPTHLDELTARVIKVPIFVVVQFLCWFFLVVETILFLSWRFLYEHGARNFVPVPINGAVVTVTGHTALITDHQLTFIQEFMMRRLESRAHAGTPEQQIEARRVLVRALHAANLLAHEGHNRLNELSSGGHAMSEYFAAAGGNPLVRDILSRAPDLHVLTSYPSGNVLTRGSIIPAQVMWARLVVGSLKGLNGEARWRGPVACAILKVAQENTSKWGNSVNRTALHRHVYTVTRKWLVSWMMFIWWEIDIPASAVQNTDVFFETLQALLLDNLVHNTLSLPHAVAEMAISDTKMADTINMLVLLLGNNWELWLQQTMLECGLSLADALVSVGGYKCVGREIKDDIAVDAALYEQKQLREVTNGNSSASIADQIRACTARQIVNTLTARVKEVWTALPSKLLDPPDTNGSDDDL